MRVDLSLQLDVIPVVFSHSSCYVFSFLNFPNFCRAEQFAEAATDAAAPFDCKCTSYTSRSPLGMAASTYGRLHGVCFHCVHAHGPLRCPLHGSVAVTFPQFLNQRLSRVRSAVELVCPHRLSLGGL